MDEFTYVPSGLARSCLLTRMPSLMVFACAFHLFRKQRSVGTSIRKCCEDQELESCISPCTSKMLTLSKTSYAQELIPISSPSFVFTTFLVGNFPHLRRSCTLNIPSTFRFVCTGRAASLDSIRNLKIATFKVVTTLYYCWLCRTLLH